MIEAAGSFKTSLYGYCSLTAQQLAVAYSQRGLDAIKQTEGEYTAVLERPGESLILTSPYGVSQYYYCYDRGRFFHSDTVLGVLRQSALSWSWNWRAVADLCQYGHTLASDTLHASIWRVPAASVVHFVRGQVNVKTLSWGALHRLARSGPDVALAAFQRELTHLVQVSQDSPTVSMSGGYDSRLILAGMLAQGLKPRLLTMGFADSSDVVISRQIAHDFELEQQIVELSVDDYLADASKISEVTNGTKLASHWHTYIYPKKARLSAERLLLVGTNGEFARSFYFPQRQLGSVANAGGPATLMPFWLLKQKILFRDSELSQLTEKFHQAHTPAARMIRALRVTHLCHYQFLKGLDRFYLEQRVRHFMGNGVRLYQESAAWRSPFVSRAWVAAVWGLGRGWKMQSAWHRFAIAKEFPRMLDYPTNKQLKPDIGYARYSDWFRDATFQAFVLDQAELLSTLMNPEVAKSVVKEHLRRSNRTEAMAFLIAMIAWLGNVKNSHGNVI